MDFVVLSLERRVLLSGGDPSANATHAPFCACGVCGAQPIFDPDSFVMEAAGTAGFEASHPLSAIPQLSSRPGATAKLYLDFDGEPAQSWGGYSVPATPAYSTDTDTTTFTDTELANIQQIWARVAEKYSPFNIDVTTIHPGSFADKVGLKVVVGGNGSWTGGSYGGVAYVGSFYNSSPNTVWIFEDNLSNGNPKYVAEAAAHEAGHAFGLQHQSSYDASGTKTQEYFQGDSQRAPIMGNSYYATRGLWWYGTSTSASTYQDDLAVLSNSLNGFGYRADDHGNSFGAATPLTLNGSTVSAAGVIERTTDSDWFSFSTEAGTISLVASVAQHGAMLDLRLELYNASAVLVASANTSSLGESLNLTVPAGTYRLAVFSAGSYGDIGQYTISGTIVLPTNYVATPTGLTATVVSAGQVNLGWTDQSNNELGFAIERSADDGESFAEIGRVGANITSFQDVQIQPGVTYIYRVFAYNGAASSDYSVLATATPVPAAPTGLTATAASTSQISLSWVDVTGETGYRIERSNDGVSGWASVGTVGAGVTAFSNTGLSAATTYYYRVIAVGLGGDSQPSGVVSGTTNATAAPTAPSSLSVLARVPWQLDLKWQDNSANETGFAIEQSTNGTTFTQIATVGANVTTFAVTGLNESTTYWFRVRAYNGGGNSAWSNTVSARPNAEPAGLTYNSFSGATGLAFNGNAALSGSVLRLTNNKRQTSSAFATVAQDIRRFTTTFEFQLNSAVAEGFTFAIQGAGPSALGGGNSGLGYSGIGSSLAIKFDINNNSGEGTSSTGLYLNGATPTTPSTDLVAAGINLRSGNIFRVTISYNGSALAVQITDTSTNATASQSYGVNIPAVVGADYAWVGFTASTSNAQSATQNIRSWSYAPAVAPPTVQIAPVAPALRNTPVNSITITFNEPVSGFGLSDLALTRDGGINLLGAGQTLTTSNNITWVLGGLDALTDDEGWYELALVADGSGIVNGSGIALQAGASVEFEVDTSAPAVSIVPVTPSPRNTAVTSITIAFDEPVAGLTLASLQLVRDGGGNLLGAGQTLNTLDQVTWVLGNIGGLTGLSGTYTLSLAAGPGIVDLAGNPLGAGASAEFVVDAVAPVGVLVDPAPGAALSVDPGYVDVRWTDAGVGLNPATIGVGNISIAGVSIDQVQDLGGGVYRYIYNADGQKLPTGVITLLVGPQPVADLVGNAAAGTIDTFEHLTFRVAGITPTPSGVEIAFTRPVDIGKLNLYTGQETPSAAADLALSLDGVPVRGSLVWNSATNTASFIATGGVLTAGVYTLTLFSRSDGWTDLAGELLDGNADGVAGGDYTTTFTIAAPAGRIVRLPDFSRGPNQAVNVPASAAGLPLLISDAADLTSISLRIEFDPALLSISNAAVGLAATGWSITSVDYTTPGVVLVSASGPALPAGAIELLSLTASVPASAPYGSSHALRIANVQLNGGTITAIADAAVHHVTFFGDTTGNGDYSGADASLIARVATGLDSGFDAHRLIDPRIVADITGDGRTSGLDAARIAYRAIDGSDPQVPPLPGDGMTPVTLSLPTGLVGVRGSVINVPLHIDDAAGLQAADLVITYDTALLDLSGGDITLGSLLGAGWAFAANVNDAAGTITLALYTSGNPLAGGAGSILNLAFRVPANALAGSTALGLSGWLNEGQISMTPASGSLTVPLLVTINNAPASSPEGTAVNLASAIVGANGGITYAWTVTKNGSAYASGSAAGFSFTPNDNGTYLVTLTAEDSLGFSNIDTRSITVTNVAPTVGIVGAPASTLTGTAISLTASVSDPGSADTFTYAWTVTRDGQPFATGTGSGLSFTPDAPGTYAISLTVTDDDGGQGSASTNILVALASFRVSALTVLPSGVEVTFNRPADFAQINLYTGQQSADQLPDLVLRGPDNAIVNGSLAWNAATSTATFIATGGILAAGAYTLTLASRADGWTDLDGRLLDGNADNTPGDDYVTTFNVAAPAGRVVSLPDFARGPDQPINIPATSAGLPITISDASGVTSVSLTLWFDPALMAVSGVVLASGMTGWSITATDLTMSGRVIVTASGPALAAGARGLFSVNATVPVDAPYGAKQILRLSDVQLNGGAIAAVADRAVHKVAFIGDATGNRGYSAMDASLVARLAAGLDSGFDAFLLTDPVILADVSGNGTISSLDATYIARTAVQLPQPEIPPLPASNTPVPPYAGVDPVLRVPNVPADAGSPVVVPLLLEESAGVQAVDLTLTYDTALLSLSGLSLGGLGMGWVLISNVNHATGTVKATLFTANPLPDLTGDLLALNMTSVPTALVGDSSPILLHTPATRLNEGRLTLTAIDGAVTISTATIRLDSVGGGGGDWTVRLDGTGTAVEFVQGETSFTRNVGQFTAIQIAGGNGDDLLTIDLANGNPLPAGGLLFSGGAGLNAIHAVGAPVGMAITLDATQVLVGGAPITWDSLGGFSFAGGDGDDALTIAGTLPYAFTFNGGGGRNTLHYTGGTNTLADSHTAGTQNLSISASGSAVVTVASARNVDALQITGSAVVHLAAGGTAALRTAGLSIGQQGALNLADNDLIIQPDAGTAPAVLAAISQLLGAGRNGGAWNGPGIRSSSALAEPHKGPRAVVNNNGSGQVILPLLVGHSLDTDSVIVKYTWHGDLNLDGQVNNEDFFRLDMQYLSGRAGEPDAFMLNADLDYNNRLDGDDYFLIDSAFLGQTAIAPPPSGSAALKSGPTPISSEATPVEDGAAIFAAPAPAAPLALTDLFDEPLESIAQQVLADDLALW